MVVCVVKDEFEEHFKISFSLYISLRWEPIGKDVTYHHQSSGLILAECMIVQPILRVPQDSSLRILTIPVPRFDKSISHSGKSEVPKEREISEFAKETVPSGLKITYSPSVRGLPGKLTNFTVLERTLISYYFQFETCLY